MNLALFGGTFNPIHFGHIDVALKIQKHFCFDLLLFIPSQIPPHKCVRNLAKGSDRCKMISMSLPHDFPFNISYVELDRNGTSYAIDTIIYFKNKLSQNDKIFFILGIDVFLEIHTWKYYVKFLESVELIVVSRSKKIAIDRKYDELETMNVYIHRHLSSIFYLINSSVHDIDRKKNIYYFKGEFPVISSTTIRSKSKLNYDLKKFLPIPVYDYIRVKGLYGL